MNTTVAVVVTYNRKEYLLRNLKVLFDQSKKVMDILVVDNASTDGTYDAIKSYIDDGSILYENTGKNIGGAGGFNYGIKYAYKKGYDFIWIMDDDTYPESNALENFLKADRELKGKYGYLAGRVFWKDKTLCKMNLPKFTGSSRMGYKQIVQSSFVSMFIPKRTVKRYGLPVKEFFIWGDDVEYTRRIALKEKSYLVEDSIAIHDTKNNVGSDIVYDNDRIERYRYAYRNEMYIARKEGIKRRIYQVLKIAYHAARVTLFSNGHKWEKIKLILSASKEGMKFNPNVEYVGGE